MKANGVLDTQSQGPYGPSFRLGSLGEAIMRLFSKTRNQYSEHIEFVAEELSNKTVVELERLSTALSISMENPESQTIEEHARLVSELKPHIPTQLATLAAVEVREMRNKAKQRRLVLT
jgi:hypothetical protein